MPATEPQATDAKEDIVLRVSQFRLFRDLVYRTTGISLADNKLEFVQARLRKRLRHHQLNSYGAYYDLLDSGDPDGVELQEMINRITTNKTSFFREEHHFEHLSDAVFPQIIDAARQRMREKKLRIWCAAASTGEEPYSLAMTVRDSFASLPDWDIRILATDIDTNVLESARSGIYRTDRAEDLSSDTLKQHFFRGSGGSADKVMVRPETAELVTFRQLNLLDNDWPIQTQFDVIFCRNVLIYFDQPTQDRLMTRMADFLLPDGSLFIGHSESLSRLNETWVRTGKTVYQHAGVPTGKPQPVRTEPVRTEPPRRTTSARPPVAAAVKVQSAVPQTKETRSPQPAGHSATGVRAARKSIIVGDVVASSTPVEVSTVLGSCIAACLFDEEKQVGGMNHFALPCGDSRIRNAASFGVHAMELLINRIMELGGDRRRLKAKVFGGANLVKTSDQRNIGLRNVEFIRGFLSTESIPVVSEFLGGECGLRVLFETHTGRARVKQLDRSTALEADRQTEQTKQRTVSEPVSDVTLF